MRRSGDTPTPFPMVGQREVHRIEVLPRGFDDSMTVAKAALGLAGVLRSHTEHVTC